MRSSVEEVKEKMARDDEVRKEEREENILRMNTIAVVFRENVIDLNEVFHEIAAEEEKQLRGAGEVIGQQEQARQPNMLLNLSGKGAMKPKTGNGNKDVENKSTTGGENKEGAGR